MDNKDLKIELKRLPGGVIHFTHNQALHIMTVSITSPCIGIVTFEVAEEASARIEQWFHGVANPNTL